MLVNKFDLANAGPRKPSEASEQSVLPPTSSSLSLPKGLLQRHGLSLGSSLGSAPGRGFARNSLAGGVLDHLQMPNRPGFKFPSRDFGKVSKTLSNVPLSPKASLPIPQAGSPRPASPAAVPVRPPSPEAATEAATEAAAEAEPAPEEDVQTQPEAAPEAVAEAILEAAAEVVLETEVGSMPEPKRPVRSRFTEEYLRPVLRNTRAEPRRAEPKQAPPPPQQLQPSTVETQTSTVIGQTDADSNLPLHGFRRHMSLREPPMGIEQIYAHPRLGRPTADAIDVIATVQPHVTESRRKATTDFMLEATEEAEPANISAEQVSVDIDQAGAAEAAEQAATAELYESDFVEDLVKTLSSGNDDDYADSQEAAVMLDLDAEMAGLAPPSDSEPSNHTMLDLDDEMDGLVALSAEVQEMPLTVDDATAVADDAVAAQGEADSLHLQDQSPVVDSTLQTLTAAVATVDTAVAQLPATVVEEQDEQELVEVMTAVTSLTQQAEAAEEMDQDAAVTSVMDTLRAQSAEHYQRSDSLVVSEALGGVQSEAADHYHSQTLATIDETLGGLVGDTQHAADADQEEAIGKACL